MCIYVFFARFTVVSITRSHATGTVAAFCHYIAFTKAGFLHDESNECSLDIIGIISFVDPVFVNTVLSTLMMLSHLKDFYVSFVVKTKKFTTKYMLDKINAYCRKMMLRDLHVIFN